MPIYEYQCTACGHQLEAFQKLSEKPLTKCPECQKSSLQKLVSAAGFQLKGTGWYATDFKTKKKTEEKSSDTKSGTDNKSTTDTKSATDKKGKDEKTSSNKGSTD